MPNNTLAQELAAQVSINGEDYALCAWIDAWWNDPKEPTHVYQRASAWWEAAGNRQQEIAWALMGLRDRETNSHEHLLVPKPVLADLKLVATTTLNLFKES